MSEEIKTTGWIKTSERLPGGGEYVLICDTYGDVFLCFYGEGEWHKNGMAFKPNYYPCWMPLPEPPEEEE